MPINNIVSTLPDPEYIKALETELARITALLQRISSSTGVK